MLIWSWAKETVSTTFNDESSKLFERAVWLWRQGRLKDAVELCNEYIKRYRRDPRGWHLLSEINLLRGSFADAIECARRAVKLKPDVPEYWTLLGRCHLVSGNKSDAISSADKAAGLGPTDPVILDSLGTIYTFADEQMRALPLFEKAVSADPDNPLLLYNLATCQRMTGQLDEAGHNLEKTIHINPKDCKAHYIRSDIRHWTPESNHIDEMERLLLDGLDNWQDEMLIRFALGKEKEDVEDYDGAFVYFSSACALKRRHMQYDVNEDIEVVDKIISTHTLDALQNLKNGHESNEPVFVLGLPRSGTTLVERIIGSHSDVHSAGELSEFAAQLVNAVTGQNGKQRLSKTEMVEASLRIDIKSLGHSYIEATRPRTGHTPRFIDKMPLNYLYCGLIHAALPNAKIITLRRNALDSCFSMYKTMFTAPYPFAYDLNDLGKYYVVWHSLMDHWKKNLGEGLLEIQYEELVTRQEAVSHNIIEFCGLDWQEACLQFHKSTAPSSTASAVQVRQPIYQSSIERWKKYERYLQPLIHVFENEGIDLG